MGEITNTYIFDPKVPIRIKQSLPECRIIICLRNPYERIVSNYSYKLREGYFNCSFEEALRIMPSLLEEVRYYSLIKPYLKVFRRNQIFFMVFDDLKDNPERLLSDLYQFLGIRYVLPEVVISGKKVNQAIVPRGPFIAGFSRKVADTLRVMGLYRVLTTAKRSDVLKSMFFKPYRASPRDIMSPEALKVIEEAVMPELDRLSPIVGRDLTRWQP